MSARTALITAMSLALGAAACGSAGEPDAAATAASPTTEPTAEATLVDDFSDPSSGWPESEYSERRFTRYEDGALRMVVDNGDYPYTVGYTTLDGDYADISIAITARLDDGPSNTGFGLACRVAGDDEGYYVDVAPDGQARLAVWPGGEQTILTEASGVDLDPADAALELRCSGDEITFLVDGVEVLHVNDDAYASGGISLSAGGAGAGVTDVRFDDLAVTPAVAS